MAALHQTNWWHDYNNNNKAEHGRPADLHEHIEIPPPMRLSTLITELDAEIRSRPARISEVAGTAAGLVAKSSKAECGHCVAKRTTEAAEHTHVSRVANASVDCVVSGMRRKLANPSIGAPSPDCRTGSVERPAPWFARQITTGGHDKYKQTMETAWAHI